MRLRRVIAFVAKATALVVVFSLALGAGVALHLGLRVPHQFVKTRVNEVLGSAFRGTIEIFRYGRIRFDRIDGIEGEVRDHDGQRVIYATDASVSIDTLALIRSFFADGALVIPLDEVTVGAGEVVLDKDETGALRLARAFEPREPSREGARPVEIAIDAVDLRHVWAHGNLIDAAILDADVMNVTGSFEKTDSGTYIDLLGATIEARGNPGLDPSGTVTGHLHLPPADTDEIGAQARFVGALGRIEVVADGTLDRRAVSVVLDAHCSPEAVAGITPSVVPRDTVHAYATVEGELPLLRAEVRASAGDGEVAVDGWVALPEADRDLEGAAVVELRNLDASSLHQEAPRTRANAVLQAEVARSKDGAVHGTFALRSQAGWVEDTSVPPFSLDGHFTDQTVIAVGHVDEPGAPTEVSISIYRSPGGAGDAHFAVATVVPDLGELQRAGDLGSGRVELFVNGQIDLDGKHLIARASGSASNLDAKGVQLGFVALDAKAEGPLRSPSFEASLKGAAARFDDYAFTGLVARAHGTPDGFDVEARLAGDAKSPSVSFAARASATGGLSAERVRVAVRRDEVDARATARAVRLRDGAVEVEGARIEGLGAPVTADARVGRVSLELRASTSRLDIGRITRLFAREEDVRGYIALDTDISISGQRAKGRLSLDVAGLEARGFGKLAGQLDVTIDDRTIRGTAEAEMGDAGKVEVVASPVVVHGPLLALDSWRRATGTVDVKGTLHLDKALALVPRDRRPVSAAAGRVSLQLRASRRAPADLPDLDGQVLSAGFAVVAKTTETRQPDGTVLSSTPAWKVQGLDATVRLDLDGKTGRSAVEARLRDTRGLLASVDMTADLPLRALLARPRDALTTAQDAPIEASITIPRRSVATLPEMIGRFPVSGEIELTGTVKGSLRKPELDLTATGYRLEFSMGKLACEHPIDARVSVKYDGAEATAVLAASTRGRTILEGDARLKLDLPAVIEKRAEPWDASGHIALTKLPLEVLQPWVRKPVRGTISGKLDVAQLHQSPTLTASFDLDDVMIDEAALPHGSGSISLKDGKLAATVALQQPDGRADLRADGSLEGSGGLLPRLSKTQPVTVSLKAKNFRLHALRPFVQGTIDSLDGRVDANLRATVVRAGRDGKVEGSLTIKDGVFSAPAIGERFNEIRGKVTMNPWGTLRLDNFSASAPTGKLTASAQAVFDGLMLKSANAKLVIKEGESIPITVQGVPMGRAFGTVVAKATMTPDRKRLDVKVDVPLLDVNLPKTKGGRPQPLAPDEHIRTGVRNGTTFRSIALAPEAKPSKRPATELRITIQLGKNVRVRKVGLVDVRLGGRLTIAVDGDTKVTGRVRVVRGELQLQGKRFVIDRATVSFVGDDPANPLVMATAYWDAPDGTRVFADFNGTPKDGKLTLRSDPAYSEDEILALLMFGSPDGTFGSGQEAGQVAQGVSAGGGVITQGLNEVISDVTSADITTRVDTSDSANPRPEVAVQISSNVTARLGYKVGAPGPGDNPDRASITLDWRFVRNWAVSAEVGDQGSTAVDVLWRFRY